MITELFQKQVHVQLNLVYSNLYDFVKCFFGEEEAEYLPDIDYKILLDGDAIYVIQQWMDEEEIDCTAYFEIAFEEYNQWFKGLNDDVSEE